MLNVNHNYAIISKMLEEFIIQHAIHTRKFQYHTSELKLGRLFDNLFEAGITPRPSIVPLDNPNNHLIWFEEFIQPQHEGCGHIRGMLENLTLYGIQDVTFIHDVLIAYLKIFWSSTGYLKNSIEFNIKVGTLEGKAISIIENEGSCKTHNPTMFPQLLGSSTFIYHEQAVNVFKKEITVKFFKSYNNSINEEEFYTKLISLANIQLEATLNTLKPANQVNFFKVKFKTSGEPTVGCANVTASTKCNSLDVFNTKYKCGKPDYPNPLLVGSVGSSMYSIKHNCTGKLINSGMTFPICTGTSTFGYTSRVCKGSNFTTSTYKIQIQNAMVKQLLLNQSILVLLMV